MNDCIFCKIIRGEIPCNKIYEDKNIIAFLDIKPVNPGHTLIVSKKHTVNILDTPESTLKQMIIATKKLSAAIKDAVDAKGINININNNKTAGQAVSHIHFHIIPRFENDGRELWHGADYKDNEAEEIKKAVKEAIKR